LPEWTFDRKKIFKRISANFNPNPNFNPNRNPSPYSNSNPNSKAQKPFRDNKMTSFFGQFFSEFGQRDTGKFGRPGV